MVNILSLDISDKCDSKVMRIFDTSHYASTAVIENYLIEVLPVNKSVWLTFHVKKGFSLALNSSSLKYKKVTEESGLTALPDGIYEIKQSHKPNTLTLVHFYHLRVIETKLKIKKEWDKLVDNKCNLSREEYFINRDKLREIDEYVDAAKFKVEECGEKKQGKELYEWAVKLLEQYTNECQC